MIVLKKEWQKQQNNYKDLKKMYNYKYWMSRKETAWPIRDKKYPHLPYKPIRNEAD
jgi:hypothetical protein